MPSRSQVQPPQQLSVECDHDRGDRHEDRPDAHRQHEPDGCQDAGGEYGDRDDVVAGGPPQVLLHLPERRSGEFDDREHGPRVIRGQD